MTDGPAATPPTRGVRAGPSASALASAVRKQTKARVVDLDLAYLGTGPDPWGGPRVAFRATVELPREDFAMNYNQVVQVVQAGMAAIGTTLRVGIDLQAVQGEQLRRSPDGGDGSAPCLIGKQGAEPSVAGASWRLSRMSTPSWLPYSVISGGVRRLRRAARRQAARHRLPRYWRRPRRHSEVAARARSSPEPAVQAKAA
ncbi:hypothetical protein ABIE67_007551 [Streptomyces sp. V4I8]